MTTPAPAGSGGRGGGLWSRMGNASLPSFSGAPSPTLTPPKSIGGGDLAGFLLGLFGYALALQFIRHGAGGPTAWLQAKFLNNTAGDPSALTKKSSAGATTASGGTQTT